MRAWSGTYHSPLTGTRPARARSGRRREPLWTAACQRRPCTARRTCRPTLARRTALWARPGLPGWLGRRLAGPLPLPAQWALPRPSVSRLARYTRRAQPFGINSVLPPIIAGGLLLAVFAAWELRAPEPMLPLRLFRNRAFTARKRVYVTDGQNGTVLVLSGRTDTMLATVPVGTGPVGATVNPGPWRPRASNCSPATLCRPSARWQPEPANPHNRGPEARTPRGSRRTSVDVENGPPAPSCL